MRAAHITVEILKACRAEPRTVREMQEITGLNYGTVVSYCEQFEAHGMLARSQRARRRGVGGAAPVEFKVTDAWRGS
jgi:DNA-binding IclR family transcriptional regulator